MGVENSLAILQSDDPQVPLFVWQPDPVLNLAVALHSPADRILNRSLAPRPIPMRFGMLFRSNRLEVPVCFHGIFALSLIYASAYN